MRVLVIGADGLIGRALVKELESRSFEVVRTSRHYRSGFVKLDIGDRSSPVLRERFDSVYFMAAITSQHSCESMALEALKINYHLSKTWVYHFASRGAHLVFPSTSSVFAGRRPDPTEDDHPDGESIYGLSKYLMEIFLSKEVSSYSIARLSKVVHESQPLMSDWLTRLSAGQTITAYSDVNLSPISISSAARVLANLGETATHETFNISGAEDISFAAFAQRLAKALGKPESLVVSQPVPRDPHLFQRYARLDSSKSMRQLGYSPESADECIAHLLGPSNVA